MDDKKMILFLFKILGYDYNSIMDNGYHDNYYRDIYHLKDKSKSIIFIDDINKIPSIYIDGETYKQSDFIKKLNIQLRIKKIKKICNESI